MSCSSRVWKGGLRPTATASRSTTPTVRSRFPEDEALLGLSCTMRRSARPPVTCRRAQPAPRVSPCYTLPRGH
ncbi:unnamed protein product [Lota lota]